MSKNLFGMVHVRLCLTCRHVVGCCNSSPNKHGTKRFLEKGHPIIKSYEPEEDWKWCYVDDIFWSDLTEEDSSLK
jgi:hypothetical protein